MRDFGFQIFKALCAAPEKPKEDDKKKKEKEKKKDEKSEEKEEDKVQWLYYILKSLDNFLLQVLFVPLYGQLLAKLCLCMNPQFYTVFQIC